jgi:hypothetical protein
MNTENRSEATPVAKWPRRWLVFATILIALAVGGVVVLVWPILTFLISVQSEISQTRTRLLNDANHSAILGTCREMMKSDPKRQGTKMETDDNRVPETIRCLGAQYVFVDRDYVRIGFGGPFGHQGFDAYSADAHRPNYEPDRRGVMHREVIPGLWYYEEE